MVDRRKIDLAWLAVVLSICVALSGVAQAAAMDDEDDDDQEGGMESHHEDDEDDDDQEGGMESHHEDDEEYEEAEEAHEGPHHTHEEAIEAAKSDSTVQQCTQDYPETGEAAYYSDEDEDEWYVEIVDTSSTAMGAPNKTAVIIDDKTGEVKEVSRYTTPVISEEDAEDMARENVMSEFLEEYPDSEVWASYHGESGRWAVTAYDLETLEEITAILDGRTGEIQTSAPTISQDDALDIAALEPAVDNFLGEYIIGVDTREEWEEGMLRNVEAPDNVLVLSRDSLGYTAVGSKIDDTNLQSVICGSRFTAPSSGEIAKITAYAYYFGGTDYKAGLYRESDNSFVAETESKHIAFDRTGWKSFEFSSPVSVTEGTDYFVVLWDYSERTTHSMVGIYYDSDSQRGGYQVDTSGGTWPDPWSPTIVDRKYSIYATSGHRSGRYTSEWYDLERASFVRFISKATIDALDNHRITVNIQVSDDESTVKDNILLNLDDGTNAYDISALADAKYVRIDSSLSTGNVLTTPTLRSFSIITKSNLAIAYENVSDQWKVSFMGKTGASATVRIDAASGEVQKTRMFSWRGAIEEFEEFMGGAGGLK